MTPIDIPEAPQDALDEIVEIIHGDNCPYTKPCPVVNQGKRAIQEWAYQETLNLLPKKEDISSGLPNEADGFNQAVDIMEANITAKWGKT